MLAIEFDQVTKWYGTQTAVNAVTFQLSDVRRLVVLGRSGAGKSTLLRLIAGLETPDAGRILIEGRDMTNVPAHRRGLSLVSQDYALYPQLSVQQNLDTALASLKLPARERQSRVAEVIGFFHIRDLLNRLPAELSGGEAQRVALAKAIVRRPRVLLLDEPLSQLDSRLREEMRELIGRTVEHYATLLILVTHDPLDALRMGQAVAVIDGGKLMQLGTNTDVYAKPSCLVAAELLSPLGVNWLLPEMLADSQTEAMQRLWTALENGASIGFRPDVAEVVPVASAEESSVYVSAESLSINVTFEEVQSLGFADLLCLRSQSGVRLRCLQCRREWQIPTIGETLRLVVPIARLLHLEAGGGPLLS